MALIDSIRALSKTTVTHVACMASGSCQGSTLARESVQCEHYSSRQVGVPSLPVSMSMTQDTS